MSSETPKQNSKTNGWLVIREELTAGQKIVLGIIPIAAILLLWFAVTAGKQVEDRWISSAILPSPVEVVEQIPSLWFKAELSRSVVFSAGRVVGGFVVALLIALPIGILMGSFSKTRALFEPLMLFGSYLPIPALLPLTMSLFGTDERQKIMFLALAFLVFLLPMVVKCIAEVDDVFLQTAETLGASKWQMVRYVLLGVSKADIYDAMRQGFGIGWTYIIVAEMVSAERGLGHIVINAQRIGPREHIYLVLLVIVLIAFLTDKIWVKGGRWLFPYRRENA